MTSQSPRLILAAASIILLAGASAQAASPRDFNEIAEARVLEESGMSFLEAEQVVKARKTAIIRAAEKADKAQTASAKADDEKTVKK